MAYHARKQRRNRRKYEVTVMIKRDSYLNIIPANSESFGENGRRTQNWQLPLKRGYF